MPGKPSLLSNLGMLSNAGLTAGVVALSIAAVQPATAADDKLVVTSHAVHQSVLTEGEGGNIVADWEAKTGVEVEFLTFGVSEAQERAFREASLSEGGIDVSFILGRFGGPQIATLFTDLGKLQADEPIEEFDEISPGMRAAHTHGGKLIGIPFRHATHGLLYNEAILEERGLTKPPSTFEEVIDYARELTFSRDDGTKVHGMAFSMEDPSSIMDWIRAFGGDFVTSDYEVVIDSPEAVQALTVLRDLAQEGVLPPNVTSFTTEDVITIMQQGRAAMTNQPFGRYKNFNDPEESKYPGEFKVAPIPMAEGVEGPHAAKTSVWAMTIPANAPHPELAWDFINFVSSKENTILAALNGNGPVRLSAYEDERVRAVVPYAEAEAQALANARIVVPGFENGAKAMDILMEEVEATMIGLKEPAEALAEAKARVEPLMPRS